MFIERLKEPSSSANALLRRRLLALYNCSESVWQTRPPVDRVSESGVWPVSGRGVDLADGRGVYRGSGELYKELPLLSNLSWEAFAAARFPRGLFSILALKTPLYFQFTTKTAYLRILKSAHSSGLLTLITFGKIRMAFDLLFSASQACLGQSFPWSTCFGDTPICVNGYTVNDFRAVGAVGVYIAQPLAVYVSLVNHMRSNRRALRSISGRAHSPCGGSR